MLSEQLLLDAQALLGLGCKERRRKKHLLHLCSRFAMAGPCPCTKRALWDGLIRLRLKPHAGSWHSGGVLAP